MALICTVCGGAYLPWSRPRDETCLECWRLNFKDAQELRVDTPHPLTERQREAALRLAVAHAREAEHQRYAEDCHDMMRQLLAGEDADRG
jgi:hypothetical protein